MYTRTHLTSRRTAPALLAAALLLAAASSSLPAAAGRRPARAFDFEGARLGPFRAARRVLEEMAGRVPSHKCALNEQTGQFDEACVSSCFSRFDELSNNACLGTGDLSNANFETVGVVFDAFPDLDDANSTQLDTFCVCGKDYVSAFRVMFSALECVLGDLDNNAATGDVPFSPDSLVNAMGAVIRFMCLKNGDTYCAAIFEDEDIVDAEDEDAWDRASNETKCRFVEELGCCGPSYARLFSDSALRSFILEAEGNDTSSTGGNDGGDEKSLDEAVADIKAQYEACGYADVDPCLDPGESATYTRAEFRIAAAQFNLIEANTTLRDIFKGAFRKDVAAALPGVQPPQVEILDLRNGSVIVDFRIRGADKKDDLDAAVSSGVALTNVRADVPAYSAVADINSTAATTSTETVKNTAVADDLGPAAAAGPAASLATLLLALAVALAF